MDAWPMRTHTHDYWGLSIVGAWVHIEADGTEVSTSPGDYSLVEGGVAHAHRCDSGVPCIGLLAFTSPRDVMVVQSARVRAQPAERCRRRERFKGLSRGARRP